MIQSNGGKPSQQPIEIERLGNFPESIYENIPDSFPNPEAMALYLEEVALDIASIQSNIQYLQTMHDLDGGCEEKILNAARALRWKQTQVSLVMVSYNRWQIRNGWRRSPSPHLMPPPLLQGQWPTVWEALTNIDGASTPEPEYKVVSR